MNGASEQSEELLDNLDYEELNDELDSLNLCLDTLNSQSDSLNSRARQLLQEMRESRRAGQQQPQPQNDQLANTKSTQQQK
jgi:chaperonin cofactor prefoldin